MSAFPQRIWEPSFKDTHAQLAPQRVLRRSTTGAAASSVSFTFPFSVPVDQIFFLRHVLASPDPGAAQVLQLLDVFVTDANAPGFGSILCALLQGNPPAPIVAGFPTSLSWQGEIALLSTDALFVSAVFDAGVAVNNLNASISGYMVPRGNWQLG